MRLTLLILNKALVKRQRNVPDMGALLLYFNGIIDLLTFIATFKGPISRLSAFMFSKREFETHDKVFM